MPSSWQIAAAALCVASCHRAPTAFSTRAAYVAKRSGARFVVYASGSAPNDELPHAAPATIIICPTTKDGHAFRLETKTTDPTNAALLSKLEGEHYPPSDLAEINEVADAIEGVAHGPKHTRIAGQTDQLVVESVDFRTPMSASMDDCSR